MKQLYQHIIYISDNLFLQNAQLINIRLEIVRLLEENIWKKFLDIGLNNDFLDMTT